VPVGTGYLDLEIDSLTLLPARYSMSLWITGGVDHILHDVAEHSVRIDVEVSSIYQAGRVVDSRWGIVYFPQRWDLTGMSEARSAGPVAAAR
jgi:hypothetical protein